MKKVKQTIEKTDLITVTGTIILAATVAAILFLFIAKSNGQYIANLVIR